MYKKLSMFCKDDVCNYFFSLAEAQHFEANFKSLTGIQSTVPPETAEQTWQIYDFIRGLRDSNSNTYSDIIQFLKHPYKSATNNLSTTKKNSDITYK
jgi:hypothetical protein